MLDSRFNQTEPRDQMLTDYLMLALIIALCAVTLVLSFKAQALDGADVVLNGEVICITDRLIKFTQQPRQLVIECSDDIFADGYES